MKYFVLTLVLVMMNVAAGEAGVSASTSKRLRRPDTFRLTKKTHSLDGEWYDNDESLYVISGNRGYMVSNNDYDYEDIKTFTVSYKSDGKIKIRFQPDSIRSIYAVGRIPLKAAQQIEAAKIYPYAVVQFVNQYTLTGPYYSWKAKWTPMKVVSSIKQNSLKKILTLKKVKIPYTYRGGGVYMHHKLSGTAYSYDESSEPDRLPDKVFLRY